MQVMKAMLWKKKGVNRLIFHCSGFKVTNQEYLLRSVLIAAGP